MKAPFDHDKIVAKQVDAMAADLELDDKQKAELLALKQAQMAERRGKKEKRRGSEKPSDMHKDQIEPSALQAAKREHEDDEKRHQQNFEKLLKPHQLEKRKARQTNNKPERPQPQGNNKQGKKK